MMQADAIHIPDWPPVVKFQGTGPALTLSDRQGVNLRFDASGRWRSIGLQGPQFLRTFDGRVVRRQRRHVEAPVAVELDPAARRRLHEQVARRVAELVGEPKRLAPISGGDPREPVLGILERVLEWDADRLEAESDRFAGAYEPVVSLPPDRARDLVLQSIDRLDAVREFLGPALELRQGILLVGIDWARPEAIAGARRRMAEGPGPVQPGDAGLEILSSDLAALDPVDPADLASAGLRSIAVRQVGQPVPVAADRWRAVGIRTTVLFAPTDVDRADEALGPSSLSESDLVHLPGATAPPATPARVLRGPVEEFLYYA